MRILLLSYCFPPVPLIEAQVAAKASGHLGASVDVIAAEPGLWRLPPDHSLDGYVEGAFGSVARVRRSGVPTLLRAQGRVPFVSQRPDALTFLNRRVLEELRGRRLGDYDLLVTRGQFHSIHLVPLRLPRRPPWVAHFSDPWVGNPTRGDTGPVRRINARREARVVEAADRLVFTSATAAEFTVAPYPEGVRAKTRQVPHCFMPELFEPDPAGGAPATRDDQRLLARHVGNLRWNRHPDPLFRALLELGRVRPGALAELRVDLLGLISPQMLETDAARALPAGMVGASAPVDYRSSLLAMRDSDLLLVTESEAERSVDLHAKIVDYTGAGVPIVGIVPPGPTAELIAALGGWHGHPGRPQEGARALLSGIEEARRRRDRPGLWGDAAVRARYSAETVGRELAEIYREATTGG